MINVVPFEKEVEKGFCTPHDKCSSCSISKPKIVISIGYTERHMQSFSLCEECLADFKSLLNQY